MVSEYIAAGAALLAAVIGYINHRRISEVHLLVNSQLKNVMDKLDTALARSVQLTDTIKETGGVVPQKPDDRMSP